MPLVRIKRLLGIDNPKVENPNLSNTILPKEELQRIFRSRLMDLVTKGWSIEIESEFEAVLSSTTKREFHLLGWILGSIILFFIFVPLAVLNLFLMIVVAISRPTKKVTMKVRLDTFGNFYMD